MNNVRYKMMCGGRRKMAIGGTATYGTEITSKNISKSQINAAGNTAASIGSGVATGAVTGATLGSIIPGVGTVIGGAVGAVGGFLSGLFGGRKKNRRRKKRLAEQLEAERQTIIQNAQSRLDNDYLQLQQYSYDEPESDGGFYAKFGGRYKMAEGGTIPNSSISEVAYGATHDQINDLTGETGVPYGDVEVEGGGDVNGIPQAGEVIFNDGQYNNVFSDRLMVPGTNKTYADIALDITNKIGRIESRQAKNVTSLEELLEKSATTLGSKAENGTIERNAEKMAYTIDKTTGKLESYKQELADLFTTQEAHATSEGYRQGEQQMRYGGRRKMAEGGSSGGGLGLGAIGAINIASNLFSYWSNSNALKFEESLPIPEQSKIAAPKYNSTYSVHNQISQVNRALRSGQNAIKRGTNNAQVARSVYAKSTIDASEVKAGIYDNQAKTESQLKDRNIEAQYQTNAYNANIDYQNRVDKYNRAIQLNSQRQQNNQSLIQGLVSSVQSIYDTQLEKYAIDSYSNLFTSDADRQRANNALGNNFGNGQGWTTFSDRLKSIFSGNRGNSGRINRRGTTLNNDYQFAI